MNNSSDTGPAAGLKEFWNKRFSEQDYVYGKRPNVFFKSVIDGQEPGKLFIPGAGEGRDAVYAATRGWDVVCIDISEAGREKALKLAAEHNVRIRYLVTDINDAQFPDSSFDLVTSIFFHLPGATRLKFYASALKWLKPGGIFALQSFTPLQLNYQSGGPKEPDMLITAEQTAGEVKGMEIISLSESEVLLDEGAYHKGPGSVLTFVGKKNSK